MTTEDFERGYTEGQRMRLRKMLRECIRELGTDPDVDTARLVLHLEETRFALRRLTTHLGRSDWPDTAWLPDVIEKHLGVAIDDLEDQHP